MSFQAIRMVFSYSALRAYNSRMMEITLALGGGGTRGAAHIGVLRVLEREGYRIRGISGSSIGSIIASFYSAGYSPDQIEERVASLDFTRLYGRLLSEGPGLLGVSGIQKWLDSHLGDRTLESLNSLRRGCGGPAQAAGSHLHQGQRSGCDPGIHCHSRHLSAAPLWSLSIN